MDLLRRIEQGLVALPAIAALFLVVEQAAARYLYPTALFDWADEVIVYLVVWSILLSLGRVSALGGHIRAEILIDRMPAGVARILDIATTALGVAFMLLLTWYSWRVTQDAFIFDDRTSSSLRFPIWIYYAALPVGCAAMTVGFLLHLIRLIAGRSSENPAP
jgi:C4-dicarboxylate transporter DctQ subunit